MSEVSKEQSEKELNVKKKPEKGYIRLLRADEYKGNRVYVRQLGKYRFEYLLVYGGEIYSSYIIIRPEGKSRRKLTDGEVSEASALIYNGAVTTVDMLLGEELAPDDKEIAELFESRREDFEEQEEEDA